MSPSAPNWGTLRAPFVLVLSEAVLVLVIDVSIDVSLVWSRRFRNILRPGNQLRQHRNDPLKLLLPVTVAFAVNALADREHVLDRSTLERRAAGDVEEPIAILQASLSIALGNVQWDRLRGT